MVNAAREPLHGTIEVDDTWIGGPQPGLRGSRPLKGRRAALVLVAVEKRGRATGRVRMGVIPDFKATTVTGLLTQHVAPGSTLYTERFEVVRRARRGWVSSRSPGRNPCAVTWAEASPRSCRWLTGPSATCSSWLIGTYHGVSRAQLPVYLDEFVFRHNRRRQPMAAFQTLLGLGTAHRPTSARRIRGAQDLRR